MFYDFTCQDCLATFEVRCGLDSIKGVTCSCCGSHNVIRRYTSDYRINANNWREGYARFRKINPGGTEGEKRFRVKA